MKKEISIDQWRDLTEEERKQIKLDNKVFIKKFAKFFPPFTVCYS